MIFLGSDCVKCTHLFKEHVFISVRRSHKPNLDRQFQKV